MCKSLEMKRREKSEGSTWLPVKKLPVTKQVATLSRDTGCAKWHIFTQGGACGPALGTQLDASANSVITQWPTLSSPSASSGQ